MSAESENMRGMTRNALKLIAIITIAIGHFFLYTSSKIKVFGLGSPWKDILRWICFVGPPIFMFFIAEGFRYTSSKRKYGLRLLVFALVTQAAYAVTVKTQLGFSMAIFFFEWNVFFALLLGFVDLCILNSKQKLIMKLLEVMATLLLSYFMKTEWWIFGQLIIIAFYYLREYDVLKFLAATVLFYLTFLFGDCGFGDGYHISFSVNLYCMFFGMLGIGLVSFFYKGKNGKKSRFMKYFFYVFYPLHLLLIDAVKLMAG